MQFKDASEVHKFAVKMDRPDLFDEVVGTAIDQALGELDLFDRNPQGKEGRFDQIKNCLPTFTIKDLKEQLDSTDANEWYCPLFLKRGEINLFGGESKKSGKTTFYLHMLKATHDGTPFLGMDTKPTNAVVLTEQGNNILEATSKAGIQDTDGIYITPFKAVAKEKWTKLIEKAVNTCEAKEAGILVIDTFSAFARLRGTAENYSGEILERFEPIIEAARVNDIHVSLLHHTGKDGDIRGSSAFPQEADVVWVLKRPPGNHGPEVRALEGLGRYDEVNTFFNVALEDGGYRMLGTNTQIEFSRAKTALLEVIPEGKENAVKRTEVIAQLKAGRHSQTTLAAALTNLVDKGIVLEETQRGRGKPKILWKKPRVVKITRPEGQDDLFNRNSDPLPSVARLNNSEVPSEPKSEVVDEARLAEIIEELKDEDVVALDLETMPPEGWLWEVVAAYRTWRRSLKNKPKPERMRAVWTKEKEKVYKQYAVNPETAHVRLVSLATYSGVNETVDATKVDVTPLLVATEDKTAIVHNGSFDLGVLRERYGYVHKGRVLDTQLLYLLHHYAEAGERSKFDGDKWRLPDPAAVDVELDGHKYKMNSLKAVAKKYLGYDLDKDEQADDWSVPDLSTGMISYSLQDTRILLPLLDVLQERLGSIGMGDIVEDIESRATPAKVWMERNGIPVNRDVAQAMSLKYSEEATKALAKLTPPLKSDKAPDGRPWTWTVNSHVLGALEKLSADLDELDKTKRTKEPSTSEGSLKKLSGPKVVVGWVAAYLEWKGLKKRSTDFIDKYAELVRENGTIPGRFDTISTGRFNCTKPNLQQVPKRGQLQTKEGMRIRNIFRAREGETLIVADFEQVELLLAATIAERRSGIKSRMLEVFRAKDSDIHRATAAWVLGKPEEDISKAERTLAKAINFGLIYGCSAKKLLEVAMNDYGVKDMKLKDTKKYRKAFFEKYPEFVAWHEQVSKECRAGQQYATTPRGRRRKLPKWAKSGEVAFTTAVNHPVQGAGADAIKLTLAKLFEDRHNCPGNPELNCTVHDEVILSVKTEYADAAKAWVEKHMADAEREAVMDLESPIAVDVEAKESWGG